MLRSGASSPLLRSLGYVFTAVCALLFGYALFAAVWAAFNVDHVGLSAWFVAAAMTCLALVLAATRYVIRRPNSGGYLLVSLACLAATVACLVSLIPLLWVQD